MNENTTSTERYSVEHCDAGSGYRRSDQPYAVVDSHHYGEHVSHHRSYQAAATRAAVKNAKHRADVANREQCELEERTAARQVEHDTPGAKLYSFIYLRDDTDTLEEHNAYFLGSIPATDFASVFIVPHARPGSTVHVIAAEFDGVTWQHVQITATRAEIAAHV